MLKRLATRWLASFGLALLFGSQLVCAQANPAPGPAGLDAAAKPEEPEAPRALEVFDDYSQVEQVAPDTTRAIVKRFLIENPSPRKYQPNISSQDDTQNDAQPALRLEQVWVGERAVLLEIKGLPRKQNAASAVMRRDTLQIRNAKGEVSRLVAFDGVTELRDRRGGSALVVAPGETLFLLFDKFDDYVGYSLFHVNRDGRDSVYFDSIDPRFRERYDTMYAAATTPLGMKDFLVEFANNDPDKRVMPVFRKFLGEMRGLKTFEGYHGAFQLLGDPKDYDAMRRAAVSEQHKAVIKAIDDEKQAEVRRKEEARLFEQRQQEAARLEQQRLADARAAEERCMAIPSCRQQVEERQAQCVAKINGCRRQCDSLTSSMGRGIMAGIASFVLYRGCASQCKCDGSFSSLFATLDRLDSGTAPARSAGANALPPSKVSSPGGRSDDKRPSAPATSSQAPAGPKRFACTIYCNSSNGPTIRRETPAGSREDAARILGEQADQLCRGAGHSKGNAMKLPASQCWEK